VDILNGMKKNFNSIEKDNSTSNICYSKSNDIMLVYIKVKEIAGGKKEKNISNS